MAQQDIKNELDLRRDLKEVTRDLILLNRELAAQMILLSSQTSDPSSLIDAVNTLRNMQHNYSAESTPRENAEVQQALAGALYALGRKNDDVIALEHSVAAYRSAITLASMIGDDHLRMELKRNYGLARNLLGMRGTNGELTGAA